MFILENDYAVIIVMSGWYSKMNNGICGIYLMTLRERYCA